MKKVLVIAAFLIALAGLAPHALAASSGSGFVPLAPIPGLTDAQSTSVINSTSLANFLNNLYRYLVGLAAILAVIEIIRGGLEISTKDSVSKKTDGKQRVYQALGGLALVLSPYVVFSIINPSILDLSLNLPAIKNVPPPAEVSTSGGGYGGGGSSTGNVCNGVTYSQFKTVPVPAGQYCANVLGSGWTDVDSTCARNPEVDPACTGTSPASTCTTCGLTATDQQSSVCNVTGAPGILQFATCPSDAAAQQWGNSCTQNNGDFYVTNQSKLTDGTVTSEDVMCETKKEYVFVNTSTSGLKSMVNIINLLQPLAVTSDNSSNASDAIQFASVCAGSAGTTCVSKYPGYSFSIPCSPTPTTALPGGASGKCYSETLTCWSKGAVSTALNALCSKNPSWAPFQ